jgi:hypothetical protein
MMQAILVWCSIFLTVTAQVATVEGVAECRHEEALQKRSFARRRRRHKRFRMTPVAGSGAGLLPDSSLKSDAPTLSRPCSFAAPAARNAGRGSVLLCQVIEYAAKRGESCN